MRRYRSWSFRAIKTSAQDFKRCKGVGVYTAWVFVRVGDA